MDINKGEYGDRHSNSVPTFVTWNRGNFRFINVDFTYPELGSNSYLLSTFGFIFTNGSTWVGQKVPD